MALYLLRPRQLPAWLGELVKASDTPAGTRWITVHPNGPDEEGQPVLIRESTTHPGTYHVVGGAEGKLNHLRLDRVGTKEDWDRRAKERKEKKQAEAEKKGAAGGAGAPGTEGGDEAGDAEEKAQTDDAISEAARRDKRAFVDAVARTLGWDDNWYKDAGDFQREGLGPTAAKLAAHQHLQNWVKQANQAHKDVQQKIRRDHESRIAAGLGNLSLDTNPYRATEAELDPDSLQAQADNHAALAEQNADDEAERVDGEVAGLQGLAHQLGQTPDAEVKAFVAQAGRPNTPEGRDILGRLANGTIAPQDAAQALDHLAQDVAGGRVRLDAGQDAKAHAEAAQLYQQANEALGRGDSAGAAAQVEEAKRLTGDRRIGVLDLIGQKAPEGRGYKAPERQRAREELREEGLTTPARLTLEINKTKASIASVEMRAAEGVWEGGTPVAVIDALQQKQQALEDARKLARRQKHDAAADLVLQAEKCQVLADKHMEKSPQGQAAVLAARNKMRDAYADVRGARGAGIVGAGDVDTDVQVMAGAQDVLNAAEIYKERQAALKEARQLNREGRSAEAHLIAETDQRIKPTPLDPAHVDALTKEKIDKILADAETGIHRQLLDRLEDEKFFQSIGGDRQVRRGQLDKYVAAGADAMMTVLGQVVGGGQMIDRAVLDTLGAKDAAKLMADYLANTLTDTHFKAVRQGLAEYHRQRAAGVAAEALVACDQAMAQAKKFEISGGATAYDLSEMEQYNQLRMRAVQLAMASVGTAYGELNMAAELNWAMGGARAQPGAGATIQGHERSDQALVVLSRALGLKDDEREIKPQKRVKGTKQIIPGSIAITQDGINRLIKPQAQEDRHAAMALGQIKAGQATTMADGTVVPGDEDGWLPQGIARRPQSSWQDPQNHPHPFAPTLALDHPATAGELHDHAAGRLAKGEAPEDVYLDLLKHPDFSGTKGWEGKVNSAFGIAGGEENFDHEWLGRMAGRGEKITRDWLGKRGSPDAALHSQAIEQDDHAVEAIHRAIAQNPYAKLAFHDVAKLDPADKAHMRDYAMKHILGQPTAAELQEMRAAEVDDGLPAYNTNGQLIDESLPTAKEGPGDDRWQKFAARFPHSADAYQAVQDHLKGAAMGAFAQTYGQVTGRALQTGTAPVHADEHAAKIAGFNPSRAALGDRVEGALDGMWKGVADNFVPGKAVKLVPNLSMSGRFKNQQRAVKAIRGQKRILAALGVGSGKTLISLGAFTDAHHHGDARAALYAVPQAVQGQFGAEAATYVDPTKQLKWHAKPGADHAERTRALGDKGTHMVVTTHQSLRDDVVKALAEASHGGNVKAAEKFLLSAPREERAAAVKRAFQHKGWEHRLDYFCVDEAHEILNRRGKPNSLMANVMDGISDNAKHYVPMTGTPIKNDPSEAWDWKQKIRPDKYKDSGRDDFLRTYDGLLDLTPRANVAREGQKDRADDPKDWSHVAMAEAFQREMAPHMFATRVPLTTSLRRHTVPVTLDDASRARYDQVTELYRRANGARAKGQVDVEATRALSPESFKGLHPNAHAARAKKLGPSLAMLREAAYNRALHEGPQSAKAEALAKVVDHFRGQPSGRGHQGKAGIVFTTGIQAAKDLHQRLDRDHRGRVGLITGNMSVDDKEQVKAGFQPPDWKTNGEQNAKYDVMVATNTVSAGMDAPRGEFVVHHDVPMTAKLHEQRTARAHRLSNDHDVDVVNLVSDTPHEIKNVARLENKYGLADMTQNPSENLNESGLQLQVNAGRVGTAMQQAQRLGQAPRPKRDLLAEARQLKPGRSGRYGAVQLQRKLGLGFVQAQRLADQANAALEREKQQQAS